MYDIPWSLELRQETAVDVEDWKAIMMMIKLTIQRAQRDVKFSFVDDLNMSNKLFVKILNFSYSLTMLLMQLKLSFSEAK